MSRRGMLGPLRRLARAHGIQAAYRDALGKHREAGPEALLTALRALGVEITRPEQGPALLRRYRADRGRTMLEPTMAVWQGEPARVPIRLPESGPGRVEVLLEQEDGERAEWGVSVSDLAGRLTETDGGRFRAGWLDLPAGLPAGYHRLRATAGRVEGKGRLIVAPDRAWAADRAPEAKSWGAFLPLYALRTRRSSGVGDFADLAALARWIGGLGGELVGTLPLLATFLGDRPHDPSPYSPITRLFWNELFVDLEHAVRLAGSEAGARLLEGRDYRRSAESLRRAPLVDYRREASLRRGVLDRIAADFFERGGAQRKEYLAWIERKDEAELYARFRAAVEKRRASWYEWPAAMRAEIPAGDYDEAAARTHLFAQYAAETQLAELAALDGAARLYLDLPLGVHPDGFDAWRNQRLFARGLNAGAPPDDFFTDGQDWGFGPIVPRVSRETGHAYVISALRNHFRFAGLLRIDHVMALYRLFWVPHGGGAKQGVYVRYPADELFAIVSLESHRHQCAVVGEDLGTVPHAVRRRMTRHGVHRMAVTQFEARADPAAALPDPPLAALASLNTHDMPPFAAFWRGDDVARRREWGWLDDDEAAQRMRDRLRLKAAILAFLKEEQYLDGRATPRAIANAILDRMAGSRARFLLANLEDLWQETEPQNVPGTTDEMPNWRRKARYTLEEIQRRASVVQTLSRIDERRRGDG